MDYENTYKSNLINQLVELGYGDFVGEIMSSIMKKYIVVYRVCAQCREELYFQGYCSSCGYTRGRPQNKYKMPVPEKKAPVIVFELRMLPRKIMWN